MLIFLDILIVVNRLLGQYRSVVLQHWQDYVLGISYKLTIRTMKCINKLRKNTEKVMEKWNYDVARGIARGSEELPVK